jgi:protein-S-isoprenylcysteine O-methyltransferase Ste14
MVPPMEDSAGVRFPPPAIYALFLGAALLLQRLLPAPVPAPGLRGPLAWGCLALATALGASSLGLFFALRVNPMPHAPTRALVVRGPYRFTRNPMYLGLLLLYLGLGALFACVWALVLAPALVATIRYYAIAREERYLAARFGEEYRDYAARVRRWL